MGFFRQHKSSTRSARQENPYFLLILRYLSALEALLWIYVLMQGWILGERINNCYLCLKNVQFVLFFRSRVGGGSAKATCHFNKETSISHYRKDS